MLNQPQFGVTQDTFFENVNKRTFGLVPTEFRPFFDEFLKAIAAEVANNNRVMAEQLRAANVSLS